MIHHGIHAALARERMNTFRAQAEADRLARWVSRPGRGREVRLRAGPPGTVVSAETTRPARRG
jgi:hypothetical protein